MTITILIAWIVWIVLSPLSAIAHYEDPIACAKALSMVREIDENAWVIDYEGISEDGRDYIFRFSVKDKPLRVEQHHILMPESQWEAPDKPAYFPTILSEWLDWDGDGVYSEWYLFPRGGMHCDDALHFIWDPDHETYRLATGGKERT